MYIIARSSFISWTKFSLSKSEIGLDTHVIQKDGFHFFQNYSVQQQGWKVKEEMPATKHVMSFAPRKNLRWYCTLPDSSEAIQNNGWQSLVFFWFFRPHKTQDRHVQPGRHYQALCTDHPSCVIANLATKHHLQAQRNSFKVGWDQEFNSILIFFVDFSARRFFAVQRAKTIKISVLLSYYIPSYQFTIQILINEGKLQKISKYLNFKEAYHSTYYLISWLGLGTQPSPYVPLGLIFYF